MVLLPRIYNEVKNGLVQNVLLEGIQGTGKTTPTRILSKGYDTLTINCSEERGIDTIREKIIGFSSSISLMGGKEKIKVIVLEECDGMTSDAFDSLRAVIEKYAPKMMSEEEITAFIQEKFADLVAAKNKGMVMKNVMPELKGKADGKVINQVVAKLCE